jgi:putative CocE/NonD family hydrolase
MVNHNDSDLPFGIPLPDRAPRAVADEQNVQDLSAARTIEVGIPMRDEVELAADVYLPPADQLPAPAPYDKQARAPYPMDYTAAGYVTVIYDTRGRGKSEGVFHVFDNVENRDGHDVVEWVAAQEWCNGRVGVTGLSYGGWLCWATLEQRPPHLEAIVSQSPAGKWQQELPYTYGCYWLYFAFWFALTRRRIIERGSWDISELVQILPISAIGDAIKPSGPAWQEFLDHEALDEYWWRNRWDGRYDFDIPVLHITGWHDREDIQGAFHHYEEMMKTSPARDRQWLLVGPWSHGSTMHPSDEYAGIASPRGGVDMRAIHLKFFDRFLRDEDNGVDDEPRVRLYDPGACTWESRPEWQGGTVDRRFFLGGDLSLGEEPAADGDDTYRYDPMDAPGVPFDVNGRWEPPLDLRELESHDGVLSWTTAPLEEPVTVRGWSGVELWVTTDRDDTEFHVKLADVDPDGRSLCVGWGCLRASHGADISSPRAVTPGEAVRYEIEITPAFHTFKAGNRIRLVLAGAEFPWFARNLNRFEPIAVQKDPLVATNTVHHGAARPSALRLPVEP